jgi:3',5'-cyclic-AMP phosphodiesterase
MNRRNWIKQSSLAAASLMSVPAIAGGKISPPEKPVLKIAHITDVHIRPGNDIPERFKKCIDEINKIDVDFILNGGDTIHAADYDHITREETLGQWEAWDECVREFGSTPVRSCLGNHDMWWAAPDEQDPMYGKKYVTERLGISRRYYSFSENGWTFFILDGNNPGITLDEEQNEWLKNELDNLPENSPALMMSHYPILTVTGHFYPDDQHSDASELSQLFYKHRDKVKCCISGHMHLLDKAVYNGTHYFCNGAVSGFWWGEGNERSAGKGYYHQTPPGYAILSLYKNGDVEREYIPHTF